MDEYVDAKYINSLWFRVFDAMISIAKSGEDTPYKIKLLISMRVTADLLFEYEKKLKKLEKGRAMQSVCRPEQKQISLPDGYTVRENKYVGVDYLDPKGNIVLQHPADSKIARYLVWNIVWKRRKGNKPNA